LFPRLALLHPQGRSGLVGTPEESQAGKTAQFRQFSPVILGPASAARFATVDYMGGFFHLTNRSRASSPSRTPLCFLLIAVRQMVAALRRRVGTSRCARTGFLRHLRDRSSILLRLRRYFPWMDGEILFRILPISAGSGFCAPPPATQTFHAGLYIRVIMLVSAVLVGLLIGSPATDQDTPK